MKQRKKWWVWLISVPSYNSYFLFLSVLGQCSGVYFIRANLMGDQENTQNKIRCLLLYKTRPQPAQFLQMFSFYLVIRSNASWAIIKHREIRNQKINRNNSQNNHYLELERTKDDSETMKWNRFHITVQIKMKQQASNM